MSAANWVVLSSDENPNYSFFAPMTCATWLNKGYRPLLFLVGIKDWWLSDKRRRLVVEESMGAGATVHFTGDFAGFRTATVAQVVRLFGALVPEVRLDDWLITADIDMFAPGAWVGGSREGDVQLYFANAYEKQDVLQFPICYLGARATAWRGVMGERSIKESLDQSLRELVEVLNQCPAKDVKERTWDFDERYFAKKLSAWSGYPDRCQKIPRLFGVGEKRIDRSSWPQAIYSLEGVADIHLPRPGFGENWRKIRPVLKLILSPEKMDWADEYHAVWMSLW